MPHPFVASTANAARQVALTRRDLDSAMWNAEVVPSTQQRSLGREEVENLKHELATAEAKVAAIQKAIREKESWLAPIRRVPADILSLVFEEFCRGPRLLAWKGPLTLGAVCRRWRQILVETPRAWSQLQVNPTSLPFSPQLLETWLSRCGAIKCDFSIHPLASPLAVKTICNHEQNIQRLSLFNHTKQLGRKFLQLEELRIGRRSQYLYLGNSLIPRDKLRAREKEVSASDMKTTNSRKRSLLDVKRYPKLQSLHLHEPSRPVLKAIALEPGFPPLQELHIHIDTSACISILRLCADTLVKLGLKFMWLPDANKDPIVLPNLTHLSYIFESAGLHTFTNMPSLVTPALVTYHEMQPHQDLILHDDTLTVESMIINSIRLITWTRFPQLKTVTLVKPSVSTKADCAYLKRNPQVCPELVSIRSITTGSLEYNHMGEAKGELEERKRLTGKAIAFESAPYYLSKPEDQPIYHRCHTICASHGTEDVYHEAPGIFDDDSFDDLDEELYSDDDFFYSMGWFFN